MVPTQQRPSHSADRLKVILIQSILAFVDLRTPASLLTEIQAILDGYTVEELAALRDRTGL